MAKINAVIDKLFEAIMAKATWEKISDEEILLRWKSPTASHHFIVRVEQMLTLLDPWWSEGTPSDPWLRIVEFRDNGDLIGVSDWGGSPVSLGNISSWLNEPTIYLALRYITAHGQQRHGRPQGGACCFLFSAGEFFVEGQVPSSFRMNIWNYKDGIAYDWWPSSDPSPVEKWVMEQIRKHKVCGDFPNWGQPIEQI